MYNFNLVPMILNVFQIYRKCYGEHVGFHIFSDSILLSLTRKMHLPDLEFIQNLGDWPLVDRSRIKPVIPIFSWCKSNVTADIILPTYELTEASLEAMGRYNHTQNVSITKFAMSHLFHETESLWT